MTEVMPPATDTAMARHYAGAKMSTERVARRIVEGLVDGRDEIVIGVSRWAKLLGRAAPGTASAANVLSSVLKTFCTLDVFFARNGVRSFKRKSAVDVRRFCARFARFDWGRGPF